MDAALLCEKEPVDNFNLVTIFQKNKQDKIDKINKKLKRDNDLLLNWRNNLCYSLLESTIWQKELSQIQKKIKNGSEDTTYIISTWCDSFFGDKFPLPKEVQYKSCIYFFKEKYELKLSKPGHMLDGVYIRIWSGWSYICSKEVVQLDLLIKDSKK